MDLYFYSCYGFFHRSLHHIHSNLKDKALLNILFHDLVIYTHQEYESTDLWIKADETQNIIKPGLFEALHSVKELYLIPEYFPFSLLSFLSTLQTTNLHKVTIKIPGEICSRLNSSSEMNKIRTAYKEKKFEITVYDGKWDGKIVIDTIGNVV